RRVAVREFAQRGERGVPAVHTGQDAVLPYGERLGQPGQDLGLQPGEPAAEREQHLAERLVRPGDLEGFAIRHRLGPRPVRARKCSRPSVRPPESLWEDPNSRLSLGEKVTGRGSPGRGTVRSTEPEEHVMAFARNQWYVVAYSAEIGPELF